MSWKDKAKETKFQTEVKTSLFPRMYYHNGEKSRTGSGGTSGEWYTKASELSAHGAAVNGHPWKPKEKFEGEHGWVANEMRLAPIMTRSQAFVVENDVTTWLKNYTAGARIYTEILCFVDGISTPMIFCLKGMTAKAIVGKGGILQSFRKDATVFSADVAMTPPWTFYVPMCAPLDKNGKPVFTDTGYKSFVTMPVAGGSQPLNGPEDLDKLYVGDEMLATGETIAEVHAAWKNERRGNIDSADTNELAGTPRSGGSETELPW